MHPLCWAGCRARHGPAATCPRRRRCGRGRWSRWYIWSAIDEQPPKPSFSRLFPPASLQLLDTERAVEQLALGEAASAEGHDDRPYLVLNMVSTADGRATMAGRSGGIGNEADRGLFHALRSVVDGVMVGAGTARVEHYGRIIRQQERRALRQQRGLAPEPLACIVSGALRLMPEQIPLLAEAEARVAIITASEAEIPAGCAAKVEYVRCARDGALDLRGAMAALRRRLEVRTLLCEGGPHLNVQLLRAGLVDELFLSLAPTLTGGDEAGQSLRILAGGELDPPVEMELAGALESGGHLFLRYRVRACSAERS